MIKDLRKKVQDVLDLNTGVMLERELLKYVTNNNPQCANQSSAIIEKDIISIYDFSNDSELAYFSVEELINSGFDYFNIIDESYVENKGIKSLKELLLEDNPNLKYKPEILDLLGKEKGSLIDINTNNSADLKSIALIMFEKELYPSNNLFAQQVDNVLSNSSYNANIFDPQYIEEVNEYVNNFKEDIPKINNIRELTNTINTYKDVNNEISVKYRRDYYDTMRYDLNEKLTHKMETYEKIPFTNVEKSQIFINLLENEKNYEKGQEINIEFLNQINIDYGTMVEILNNFEKSGQSQKIDHKGFNKNYLKKFVDETNERKLLNKQIENTRKL